ncbi:helix-turn-helix domain-containing protein [Streptomyces aureus]
MRTLGARLRALRVDVGLTGAVLAQRAGVGQPTVSKVENGRMVPSRDVLDRLSGALGLDAAVVAELRVALAEVESAPSVGADEILAVLSASADAVVDLAVRGARLVRSFQCVTTVRFGVLPWDRPVPVMPRHGFTLCGQETVVVETFRDERAEADPDVFASYKEAFAQFESAAVFGDEARELLMRIMGDLRVLAENVTPPFWHGSGTRGVVTADSKKARVGDLGLIHGAGDENRTRTLSLGS